MAGQGRHSEYTPEMGSRICEVISTNARGLDHFHKEYDWFPDPTTIYYWLAHQPDFSPKYYKARELQSNLYAEATIEIADKRCTYIDSEGNERIDAGSVQLQKLQINTRQWHASKLAPKRWGDKKELEEVKAESATLKAELQALRDELAASNKKDY